MSEVQHSQQFVFLGLAPLSASGRGLGGGVLSQSLRKMLSHREAPEVRAYATLG